MAVRHFATVGERFGANPDVVSAADVECHCLRFDLLLRIVRAAGDGRVRAARSGFAPPEPHRGSRGIPSTVAQPDRATAGGQPSTPPPDGLAPHCAIPG